MEKAPTGVEVHVDLKRLNYIDHACLEILTNWSKQFEANGGRMIVDWEQLHMRLQTGNGHGNGTVPRMGLPPFVALNSAENGTANTRAGEEFSRQESVNMRPG